VSAKELTALWRRVCPALCRVVGSALLLCAASVSDHARAAAAAGPPTSQDAAPLAEVAVTAPRDLDRHTLEDVAVPHFVESHGVANERSDQVGRWRTNVCPATIGLQDTYNEYISRRIAEVARSVGAPTPLAGQCAANINVIITSEPQKLLDSIASKNRALLGYSAHWKELGKFSHPIQAWYVTGTRSQASRVLSKPGAAGTAAGGMGQAAAGPSAPTTNASAAGGQGGQSSGADVTIDSDDNPLTGEAGSLLGHGFTSEIVRVTIIADANTLGHYPLRAIADYIAMLALTRATLTGCNPLRSIIDLLSVDCAPRARPESITEADTAYLQALYASTLDGRLNVEQSEMRTRMLKSIGTDFQL